MRPPRHRLSASEIWRAVPISISPCRRRGGDGHTFTPAGLHVEGALNRRFRRYKFNALNRSTWRILLVDTDHTHTHPPYIWAGYHTTTRRPAYASPGPPKPIARYNTPYNTCDRLPHLWGYATAPSPGDDRLTSYVRYGCIRPPLPGCAR